MQGSNYILTRGLIAKLQEFQGPNWKQLLKLENGSFWAGDCSLVFFLCNGSAIKGRDVSPLNGVPHAITAGCYSADRSPSPIKTQVKATSWGDRGGEEENRGGTTGIEREIESKKRKKKKTRNKKEKEEELAERTRRRENKKTERDEIEHEPKQKNTETRKKGGRKGDRRQQGSVFLALPWS